MSELRENTEVRIGSDRSFGLVFAVVFAVVALLPLWHGGSPRWWALAVALALVGVAFVRPAILHRLNRLWFRFGLLLSRVVSPIVMAVLFVTTIVPIGLVMRLRGADLLKRSFDPDAETYWIPVDPQARAETSMRNQF
jgi:hypothetical protein